MKRQTAMALAAVFAMSVAGTALAAPANPFADVPAKHWSYDSVNKLAQAGVISGYGDGTYKGDKTLTRYEMATIVAKAMANADKADAETKKTIEALKAEYGTELSNLGVRVDNLEKNASKVKFTGEIRERYEWDKETTANAAGKEAYAKTRVRITMTAPIADNVTFKGRLHSESEFGAPADAAGNATNTVVLDQAYITGKLGDVTYSFGRQPVAIGQSLLYDNSQNNDGLLLSAGKDIRVTAGAFKLSTRNFTVGNIAFKVNDTLGVTTSYIKDDLTAANNHYDSKSIGFKYTGLKNFTFNGEYGQNDSDNANLAASHLNDPAKAGAVKAKYLGAVGSKVKSYGVWVGYRKAQAGFDPDNRNNLADNSAWGANGTTAYLEMDNIKGIEYGFEYALFKNGILTLQYNDMEAVTNGAEKSNFITQLVYTF